jgi:hypothetical protein
MVNTRLESADGGAVEWKFAIKRQILLSGGEDSAISFPVGVHPVIAIMISTIALKQSPCAAGALYHNNKHPERMFLRDFKY